MKKSLSIKKEKNLRAIALNIISLDELSKDQKKLMIEKIIYEDDKFKSLPKINKISLKSYISGRLENEDI